MYIDIGKANVRQSQIALQPLVLKSESVKSAVTAGAKIYHVLKEDLQASGDFKLIDQAAFLEKPGEKALKPYPQDSNGFIWKNWVLLDADYLVMGSYTTTKGTMNVDVFLYQVSLRRKMFQKEYRVGLLGAETLAHHIAGDIVKAITQKKGPFLTKIVSVRNTKGQKKELFLMDWNGRNKKQISFHRSIVLTPAWSPTGRHIAYTAFLYQKKRKRRNGSLILYNLKTGSRRLVFSRRGINMGFDFFPNGKSMLMSLFLGKGYMDIAEVSLTGPPSVKPLTFGPNSSINVEPVLHPDGKTIIFSSDRGGRIRLYSMNRKGQNIRPLNYQGNYNSTPDFSPDGKQVVFSGYSQGRFDIFIMNADGARIRRLTSFKKPNGRYANNESPGFSPDGRFIVFTSNRTGRYQLYIMNLHNQYIQQITNDSYNYKSPEWSPFL